MSPHGVGRRADQALVAAGLARSRRVAAELIRDGRVLLDDRVLRKPATLVGPDQTLRVERRGEEWVGRAAHKLLGALETFEAIDPAGRRCIDAGASTGGFTQVLLRRGARHVVAIDVGHDQLVPEIRDDPRVEDLSGVNLRDVTTAAVPGRDTPVVQPGELVVCDLSFISLVLVMPTLAALTAAAGDLVALVKPQFEVGRDRLGHGGVVRSAAERRRAVDQVVASSTGCGLHVHGVARSRLTGANGNQEYLLWARHAPAGKMADVHTQLDTVVGGAADE